MALTILAGTSIHRHISRLRDRARHSPSSHGIVLGIVLWLVPSILQTLAEHRCLFCLVSDYSRYNLSLFYCRYYVTAYVRSARNARVRLVSTRTEFIAPREIINLASKMRSADLGAEGPVATVRDLINYPFLDHIWRKRQVRATRIYTRIIE